MNAARWQSIETLYHSACDLPDEQRNSFLQGACGGDQSLVDEVESLVKHGSTPQSVLDSPAISLVAKAIASDERDSPAPLLDGKTISHYRILRVIGRGGMGVVYEAEDLKLRRHVALKLLPQSLAKDSQALRRFEQEAQAASALNHPNICTVYEIGEAAGLHFIAIELLEGETLKERIARGAIEVRHTLGIVMDICHALEAAHAEGIIHRDIKPSNILLTRRGNAKLLDFGVAKRMGPELVQEVQTFSVAQPVNLELRLTSPGAAIGTVAYMSPEQARGQHVDPRSDLFSLGAVLYEMTTGQCPFPGKGLADIIRAIEDRQPTPIQQFKPSTPLELIRITNKALQKDRSLRYQSAADMRADLQALYRRLETRVTKRKARLILALVAACLAIGAFGSLRVPRIRDWMFGHPVSETREVKSLAVLPLDNLTGDSSQEYFVDGMTDALITNLTKLGSLRVISRTSAMHYKGTHKALPEIAHELNVNAVLEGSVARFGNRVRISAQLADAISGQNLWGRDYERDVQDVLQLQNDLATAVAQEVAGKLTPQEQRRLVSPRSVNPAVYETYLKGRFVEEHGDLHKALEYFHEAIRLDPNYAPAYSGLADTYVAIGVSTAETPEAQAMAAARKAVTLDDSLAEAHASLGFVLHRFEQDWSGAEKEFRRAFELNPNYALAHTRYGVLLATIGRRTAACDQFRLAHSLDPLFPGSIDHLAQCLFETNHFGESIQMLKDAIEVNPGAESDFRGTMGELYDRRGMFPEAVAQYERVLQLEGRSWMGLALLAGANAGWGKIAE
ncbi:MAG TPA: protein kinase, partial [Acidobacteriota bacterium]|nr:protein kinase [Acidobacteriota bacterium]